ncbi:MAG: YfcE family phosphodiesterase [Dehalococcoidales bacterium]|nr:YfcE family phosphodiesterase [Dehalococcoidales bacterium]
MKRICVLGDTHIKHWHQLSTAIKSEFSSSDYILHLGDFDSLELLEEFKKSSKFYGITGNHDGPSLKALLPAQDIIEIDGKRLGLVHGHGCSLPWGLRRGLQARFRGEKLDAILYGHTHRMNNVFDRGTLFFNPGSAAGRFPAGNASYGVITVNATLGSNLFTVENTVGVEPSSVLPEQLSYCVVNVEEYYNTLTRL